MYSDRLPLYASLEKARKSKLLVYVTGDRMGMETRIAPDVLEFFADHLDSLTSPEKVSPTDGGHS